ncbi:MULTISPECIES: hypothetical protein [unclassified Cupriavidus]|jgi:hypothetical protein|uniref:hypothetical protein n=1 Tax=unclassified Cupriavidus TaxID=2640874 RepID=UPI001C00339B|nr:MULTISPECIES: hypothetical protein [unclassified Cupriavidus]MCA3185570.1 hypothetical protein [Cupriavidus sp.]MCA3189578.1 hypothetical protein [Cupriavidus sp.]MCA3195658.1 hypothetical protein [Cupriavidus sp.]MCA3201213.1 hypothetical protein [Cupriavidus sp.]MCA3209255.1 hypothetical protein [Cupriavidus sp.]
MPTIIAGFAERSTAGAACRDLVESYPGLNVAMRLPPEPGSEAGGEGFLAELRSLMVEIVGVQSADGNECADGCSAKLVVSDVPVSQLESAKALLSKHRAFSISELSDGAGHELG